MKNAKLDPYDKITSARMGVEKPGDLLLTNAAGLPRSSTVRVLVFSGPIPCGETNKKIIGFKEHKALTRQGLLDENFHGPAFTTQY